MTSSTDTVTSWTWHAWTALAPDTLHGFLKLRSDIFVVEQNCVFPEMDGLDPLCEHLCGTDAQGRLLAYLRLVPPGVKSAQPGLGRLVVDTQVRRLGLGRAAIAEGIRHCRGRYPGQAIFLAAQQHLTTFYATLGFRIFGEPYSEDGIQHVNMLLPA
ncbi:MAG: GNAT family N-acetyltransferase [Stenotrophobium sp.]